MKVTPGPVEGSAKALGELCVFLRADGVEIPIGADSPEAFITTTNGQVVGLGKDANDYEVGRFRTHLVDLDGARDKNLAPQEVLDTNGETEPYISLYSQDGELRESTCKACGYEIFGEGLLILDRLEILPPFRGKGLGPAVIQTLIRSMGGGAGLVALKPFPLQLEGPSTRSLRVDTFRQQMGYEQMSQDARKATKSLKAYYASMGFVPLRGTTLMVGSTAWRILSQPEVQP